MVIRKKSKKRGDRLSMRLTGADKKRIAAIKKRTGVTNRSEAVRIALKGSARG